jgi:hypothetical protein
VKLKLMILGYARHGKDTVAEILREHHKLKIVSSSLAAAERVMVPYFKSIGINYASLEECYVDRVNHRSEWYDQIKAFNTPDLARLAREIYSENDVYIGIRNAEEFQAARKEGLFQYSIWVDRSKHEPAESISSNTMDSSMADYIIDNNGTLEQLKVRTLSLYWDLVSLEHAGALRGENKQ